MRTVKTYVRYAGGLPHKRTEVYENDTLVQVIWQRLPDNKYLVNEKSNVKPKIKKP